MKQVDDLQAEHLTLFRSDTLVVRAHVGRRDDICFVVFDPMVDDPSLDREAFGEAFFAAYGFDAVHILSARNGWYQDPTMPAALDAAASVSRRYRRVVTYGSSMGGYAALRFSERLGAQAVIAISPQYSMLPPVVPFESRWTRERNRVTWLHEAQGDRLPAVADAFVLYDDRGLDRGHAAAILRDLPNATLIPMPYAGHPVGAMLAEMGVMASTVIEIAQGTLDAPGLRATIRRNRQRSGQYLFTLARRQPLWRLRLKARLARRAIAAGHADPAYLTYAGLVLECLGEQREALALHTEATRRPGYGMSELRHAHILCREGRIAEAALAAERARGLMPLIGEPAEFCALIRAMDGAPADALDLLATTPRLVRRPDLVRLLGIVARAPILRTGAARAIGAWFARWYVRRTVLDRREPLRQLVLADMVTR